MGPKIFQKSPFWEFLLFHLNSKIPSISLTHPNVVRFSKFLFRWKADENSYLFQTLASPVHPLHPQFRNPCLCLIAIKLFDNKLKSTPNQKEAIKFQNESTKL